MISVGVLVANSTRPRAWMHISALKRFSVQLEDNHEDRKQLEDYFEQHKSPVAAPPAEEPWSGWEEELSRATVGSCFEFNGSVLTIFVDGSSSLSSFPCIARHGHFFAHTLQACFGPAKDLDPYPPSSRICLSTRSARGRHFNWRRRHCWSSCTSNQRTGRCWAH